MVQGLSRVALIVILGTYVNFSCSDSKTILHDKNFDSGDWLFVNFNYVKETLQIIDDEAVLRLNSNGIRLTQGAECGGTTCDGFLMLYKDGRLVEQQEYLTRNDILESDLILNSYRVGEKSTLDPIDKNDFTKKWDSLKSIKNIYPTIYHTQPEDRDIILVYTFE